MKQLLGQPSSARAQGVFLRDPHLGLKAQETFPGKQALKVLHIPIQPQWVWSHLKLLW